MSPLFLSCSLFDSKRHAGGEGKRCYWSGRGLGRKGLGRKSFEVVVIVKVLCGGLVVWGDEFEGAQEKRAKRTLNFRVRLSVRDCPLTQEERCCTEEVCPI